MNKEKKEELKWFIQFANINFDDLKLKDRAKLEVEAEEFLYPKQELKEITNPIPNKGASLPLVVYKSQLPEWIFKQQQRGTKDYWDKIANLQKEIRGVLSGIVELKDDPQRGVLALNVPQARIWSGKVVINFSWDEKEFRRSFIPLPETHWEFIRLKIYGLLDGIQRWAIRTCQECNKYFLDATRRKKKFCSNECNWKYYGRKRRQTPKYKISQAKRMWEKYPKTLQRGSVKRRVIWKDNQRVLPE